MGQQEARISREIMKALRAEGAFCFKVHGSEYMMAGLPDIIGCYQGLFFAFETKRPEKRSNTSPEQDKVMGLINQSGAYAEVVCSKQEAVIKLLAYAARRSVIDLEP